MRRGLEAVWMGKGGAWTGGGNRRLVSLGALIGVLAALTIFVVIEGGISDSLVDARDLFRWMLQRFGVPGSMALLYIEESGIPLPVPGDVYVTYIGHHAAGSTVRFLAAWIGIIAVVVAGATNLYLVSRRWGPRLLAHPAAAALHLHPHRVERAHRWFERWGVVAVVFGRHIPGFRVPITVVAGTLGFPYRLFAPSVAVSTAVWAGVFLYIGARFGRSAAHYLGGHSWIYAVGTLVVVGLVALIAVRTVRASRQGRAAELHG